MELKKAQKKLVKLKIGISGASGFGKTYSALLLAYGITGDWAKIGVIDSEKDSSSLYSDLGDYNTISLLAPYSPERYIEAINICVNAGMECVIIDSISHEWEGKGGCLEICESLGGRFTDWAKVTPRHTAFVDAILSANCHVITTVRRKQDYELVKNEKGKAEPVKVGMKEITRDGFEYELTVNFEILNDKHLVRASKDRTGIYANAAEHVISSETGKKLMDWANNGFDELKEPLCELDLCTTELGVKEVWDKYPHLHTNKTFKSEVTKKKHECN